MDSRMEKIVSVKVVSVVKFLIRFLLTERTRLMVIMLQNAVAVMEQEETEKALMILTQNILQRSVPHTVRLQLIRTHRCVLTNISQMQESVQGVRLTTILQLVS